MPHNITKAQAARCFKALTEQYAKVIETGYEPVLRKNDDDHPGRYEIVWEHGPDGWAVNAFRDHLDEEVYILAKEAGFSEEKAREAAWVPAAKSFPSDKVWAEAINHYSVALFPCD